MLIGETCLNVVTGAGYYDGGFLSITVKDRDQEELFHAKQQYYKSGSTIMECFEGVARTLEFASTNRHNKYYGTFHLTKDGAKVKSGTINGINKHNNQIIALGKFESLFLVGNILNFKSISRFLAMTPFILDCQNFCTGLRPGDNFFHKLFRSS